MLILLSPSTLSLPSLSLSLPSLPPSLPPSPPSYPEDQCYYPQTEELSEYVLNNSGNIWVGSSNSNYGRPWQFAQFKQDALEVALWAINKTTPGERDNPILVSDGEKGEGGGEEVTR